MQWVSGNLAGCLQQWKQVAVVRRSSYVLWSTGVHLWQHKRMIRLFGCWRKTSRRTRRVITSLDTLEAGRADEMPMWSQHKLNWGMQVAKDQAPKGVGGLSYASATLANHDRDDWA